MRVLAWMTLESADVAAALAPGDLVGRSAQAALRVDDGRVSEAHALVSLRGGNLWLLALRGRLVVQGRVRPEVLLEPGRVIELAEGVRLRCDQIDLPEQVLALQVDAGAPQPLVSTTSVFVGPPVVLRAGFDPDADAVLWTLGEALRLSLKGQPPQAFAPGDAVTVGGATLRATWVTRTEAGCTHTARTTRRPIEWWVGAEAVRLRHGDGRESVLTGIPGRLLALLMGAGEGAHEATSDVPVQPAGEGVPWRALCARVWPDDRSSEASMRNRLDVGLAKVRARLRALEAVDVRVAMDGNGVVQLSLPPEDRVRIDGAG